MFTQTKHLDAQLEVFDLVSDVIHKLKLEIWNDKSSDAWNSGIIALTNLQSKLLEANLDVINKAYRK